MQIKLGSDMLPIGPLMIEHRLIERMVSLLKKEAEKREAKDEMNINFIGIAVDFFRFYADRCHHGKEEDILFRDLQAKPLSPEHKKMIEGLLQDHVHARELVGKLDNGRLRYLQKDTNAAKDIQECLKKLIDLYTVHIQKEDKQFFIPAMVYFNKKEQDTMLCEFGEFDKMLIHEKYKKLVEQIEKGRC